MIVSLMIVDREGKAKLIVMVMEATRRHTKEGDKQNDNDT
jgi:hypothetical protein